MIVYEYNCPESREIVRFNKNKKFQYYSHMQLNSILNSFHIPTFQEKKKSLLLIFYFIARNTIIYVIV